MQVSRKREERAEGSSEMASECLSVVVVVNAERALGVVVAAEEEAHVLGTGPRLPPAVARRSKGF